MTRLKYNGIAVLESETVPSRVSPGGVVFPGSGSRIVFYKERGAPGEWYEVPEGMALRVFWSDGPYEGSNLVGPGSRVRLVRQGCIDYCSILEVEDSEAD